MDVPPSIAGFLLTSDVVSLLVLVIFVGLIIFGIGVVLTLGVKVLIQKYDYTNIQYGKQSDIDLWNDTWATAHHETDTYRRLAAIDPNFSRILFLEFAHLVLVKYHESRGGLGESDDRFAVAPYLSPALASELKESTSVLTNFVVCSTRLYHVRITRNYAFASVMYRSMVTERGSAPMLVTQTVCFRRPRGLKSRPPDKVLELGCPNCGSASEAALDGSCPAVWQRRR